MHSSRQRSSHWCLQNFSFSQGHHQSWNSLLLPVLLVDIVSFWGEIWLVGVPRNSLLLPVRLPRQCTDLLLILLQVSLGLSLPYLLLLSNHSVPRSYKHVGIDYRLFEIDCHLSCSYSESAVRVCLSSGALCLRIRNSWSRNTQRRSFQSAEKSIETCGATSQDGLTIWRVRDERFSHITNSPCANRSLDKFYTFLNTQQDATGTKTSLDKKISRWERYHWQKICFWW